MKKILNSLRNKPDHVKTRYVIAFSIIATVCIIGTWVLVNQSIKSQDENISAESPFKAFKDIFSATLTQISETAPEVNEKTFKEQQQDPSQANQDTFLETENNDSDADENTSTTENQATSTTDENQEDFQGIPRSVVE